MDKHLFHKECLDYRDLLRECFQTDPELLSKWHLIAGEGLDKCVDKTFNDLKACNVKIFKIIKDDELVGYFGKEDVQGYEFLTGFFITPEFRSNKDEVWSLIKSDFKKPFFCGLYEKNTPANRFIQKRGGILIQRPENGCLYRIEE